MNKQSASLSFPFASVLTIVFIVLKLTHVIAWSWLWVLAPLWITFGIVIAVLGLAVVLTLIVKALDK